MASLDDSIALVTEAELEELLDTAFDTAYINALINTASSFINKYCGRTFIETTYTEEVYDGNGLYELYLKNAPISSVTIEYWDTTNNASSYTYIENTDYLINSTQGKIYNRSSWIKGHQNYHITYTAGYAIADIPYDLKMVCAKICEILHNNQGKSGISSETMGRYSVTYNKQGMMVNGIPLPIELFNVLNQYRRFNEQ